MLAATHANATRVRTACQSRTYTSFPPQTVAQKLETILHAPGLVIYREYASCTLLIGHGPIGEQQLRLLGGSHNGNLNHPRLLRDSFSRLFASDSCRVGDTHRARHNHHFDRLFLGMPLFALLSKHRRLHPCQWLHLPSCHCPSRS